MGLLLSCNKVDKEVHHHSLKEAIPWERKDGRDPFKYYEPVRQLGSGSMGSVVLMEKKTKHIGGSAYKSSTKPSLSSSVSSTHSSISNSGRKTIKKQYAMKMINMDRVSQEFYDELRNEIQILRSLDHPNIVKLYEIYDLEDQIFIFMECCSGGDLWTRCPYVEDEALTIIEKLTLAIAHMHKVGITHRDLKMENILFESQSRDAEIKIIDFGLSSKFRHGEYMHQGVGTVYTMAPEVLVGNYTNQADMWSLGVITYIVLSNRKPFNGRVGKQIVKKIMKGRYDFDNPIWNSVSTEAKNYIKSLLQIDPKMRMTADQAKESEWLRSYDSEGSLDLEEIQDINKKIEVHGDSNLLKKLSLLVVAYQSSGLEVSKLRHAFSEYDVDHDGIISFEDFNTTLKKFGYDNNEIKKLFQKMDVYQDGKINYTEFIAATLEAQGQIEEDRIAEAFHRIDSDDTGKISKSNLKKFLGGDYDSLRVSTLIEELDEDKDGQICYDEFVHMFERRASQRFGEK